MKVLTFLQKPLNLTIVNLVLILSAIIGNMKLQVFCIPINWSIPLLATCFLFSSFFPLIVNSIGTKFNGLLGFINGISFFVFLYCIIFLERFSLAGVLLILLFGLGLLVYIPHYFLISILYSNLIKPISLNLRRGFIAGLVSSIIVIMVLIINYQKALTDIDKLVESNYQSLNKGYFTEKILGAHFKYHTRICPYDGWRPPIHDPALIIGLWSTSYNDPLSLNLEQRINLYQKFFPDKPIKVDCSCANEYKDSYHNSYLWK